MSKHTPGPWVVDDVYNLITADNGNVEIAACHSGRGADAKANAQLISAAPELLEALKGFVLNKAHLSVDDHFNGPFRRLLELSEQLIEKAEGK